MTGRVRTAIDVTTVKLYSSPPRQFEDVALVTSEAESGWSDQAQVNNAIAGLKKKAAQLGANGLLIEATSEQCNGALAIPSGTSGFLIASDESQTVKSRAIFVAQE